MIATVGSASTALSTLVALIDNPPLVRAATTIDVDDIAPVVVPLEFVPTLGAYVVRYTLFGEEFAAVVDTGSPFLTVPSYCKPYRNQKMRWGCYRPELTQDSGYANTIEGFDNNYGRYTSEYLFVSTGKVQRIDSFCRRNDFQLVQY